MPKLHRLRDVDPVAIALCKKGANGQRIFLRKSEAELVTIAERMELHKAKGVTGDWTTLYCVVAQPDTRENGGMLDPDKVDVWDSPEEIRKAAHRLMKNRGVVNLEHGETAEADVVESAVALAPIALDGVTVPAGAWYVGIEPSTELRKAYDDGELTGISLEGTGVREEAGEIDDEEPAKLFERLAKALGLRNQTGTLAPGADEENDVDTAQLETKVEEIAKAQSATTTAIEGLVATVDKLMTHFESDEKRKAKEAAAKKEGGEGEETPSPADLKKSIDELTATFADKLDDLEASVDKLAASDTSQPEADRIAKAKSDNPLAGILS